MNDARHRRVAPWWLRTDGLKTMLLLLALATMASLVGWLALGKLGLLLGGLVVGVSLFGLRAPNAMLMRLTGATRIPGYAMPGLHRLVARLSASAGISPPALYFSSSPLANAMAVGQRHDGAIAVTRGLLQSLSPRELEAVLAHELAHLANGDSDMMRLAGSVANTALGILRYATWLAVFILLFTGAGLERLMLLSLLALLAPPLIRGLHTAISREREFAADACAAAITTDAYALASALRRLEWHNRHRTPWTLLRRAPQWLSSHPATDERVARLLGMHRSFGGQVG